MRRYRIKIKFPESLKGPGLAVKREQMAPVLLRQSRDRIAAGGDDDYTFPPLANTRADGGPPLSGHTLPDSLRTFVTGGSFGVTSDFVGAAVLLHGTVGKGGSLPTIVPKRAKVLRFWVGGKVVFAHKVDIEPRKYLRLSGENVAEFGRILSGGE